MTEESGIVLTLDDPSIDKNDPNRALKDILAGTVGGIAQVLTGQPFDTTKVRLQSASPGTYSSSLDVVKKLISQEGPLAFYKGTLTPLLGIGACVSIQFGVNEFMKRYYTGVNGGENRMSSLQFLIAGGAGGFFNGFLASPIEHIRIRLQTQTTGVKEFNGPLDVVKKLYTKGNGVTTIFRGLGPTLVRESWGIGIYFMTFEALVKREMDTRHILRKDVESWKLCTYGGLAGYAMWLSCYPVDVVKSTMQTDNYKSFKYKNSFEAAKSIMATNGIKGFFKGFTPTILRAAPANAATFLAFEQAMRAMG